MADIEILYNTAVLHIAEKLQRGSFYRERVHIQKNDGCIYRQQKLFLTPHTRATIKMFHCVVDALHHEVTPRTIDRGISNAKLKRGLRLSEAAFQAFVRGGAESILQHYRIMFAYSFENIGVKRTEAYEIAWIILLQPEAVIEHINTVDDTGDPTLFVVASGESR